MTARFLAVPCPPEVAKAFPAFDWTHASLAERCLHLARAHERMGVREITQNWGPWVKAYLAVAGWKSPAPWCAAFVYYTLVTAGADKVKLWKYPASTWWLAQWARETGRLSKTPKRGRAFFWNTGKSGHTGWVASLDGPRFDTIEGNTDRAGSREGDGVYSRVRTVQDLERNSKGSGLWGFADVTGLEV
jgi:hypothetical protein